MSKVKEIIKRHCSIRKYIQAQLVGVRMRRTFIEIFLIASLVIVPFSATGAQGSKLRYFLQPEGVSGSITPYGNNANAGKYVLSGDARIYYEVYGAGEPVFIFHGGGVGSPYELGKIIDELRKRYKVVVISSRGHGHSEIGHSPISLEQKAADMLAVMTKITNHPAPVIGFSDGAYTAYKLAATKPEAVEKLVAMGAGTLKPGFFPKNLPIDDLEKMDASYVAQMRSLLPEPERLQEFLNDYMKFWSNEEIGADLLTKIQCPVLLLGGDHDDHAPPATILEAEKLIPDAEVGIIPHAGHTAFLDNFPVTWNMIDDFLTKK